MSQSPEEEPLLSSSSPPPPKKRRRWLLYLIPVVAIVLAGAITGGIVLYQHSQQDDYKLSSIRRNIIELPQFCDGPQGKARSGLVDLRTTDGEEQKRFYFILQDAQHGHKDAPLIVTIGGGPGTSGQLRFWNGDGPCVATESGVVSNPHTIAEHYNYLAVDYPTGVGFSHGAMVNNSAAAAKDMYDFLQRFYRIFPKLADNPLVINGGSYGGMYIPHIAHEIDEGNKLVRAGKGFSGARRIPLESVMISNPVQDPLSYLINQVQSRCGDVKPRMWNDTECIQARAILPDLVQKVRIGLDIPTLPNKIAAMEAMETFGDWDRHGMKTENVRERCNGTMEDCFPEFTWTTNFIESHRQQLGAPDGIKYELLGMNLNEQFVQAADIVQRSTRFFPALVESGIRILHRVGMLDLNCAWDGVLSGLTLVDLPFRAEFVNATDIPWPGEEEEATVRVIGEGAGDFTYIQLWNAGHFVVHDATRMEKKTMEYWIENKSFFDSEEE